MTAARISAITAEKSRHSEKSRPGSLRNNHLTDNSGNNAASEKDSRNNNLTNEVVQGVCVLGSTGTVGCQTLEVIQANLQQFSVFALCANTNVDALFKQCVEFRPKYVIIRDASHYQSLLQKIKSASLNTEVLCGDEGIETALSHPECHIVMSAIVGAAGLKPTKFAIECGKKVLIANKEPLVMVGDLLIGLAQKHQALILPVDSEHNAIQQCLPDSFTVAGRNNLTAKGVKRLMLTGSGGPFLHKSADALHDITVEQACKHPNWVMGPKISIDSATMMNKSLELIEACCLFHLPEDKIDIVIHPQSIIHSMVEYIDGSVIAQMATSDMKVPIANALSWPDRIVSDAGSLNFFKLASLDFLPPDTVRFPALRLAREAARLKGFYPNLLNAANEQAVALFISHKIRFTDIMKLVEKAFDSFEFETTETLTIEAAIEFDLRVRSWVAKAAEKI